MRESLWLERQMDFIITQTQRIEFPFSNVFDNTIESGGYNDLDMSHIKSPRQVNIFRL